MLPYAELVQALATVPRVTLHGPWSRTIDHVLLTAPPPGSSGTRPEPLWPGGAFLHGGRFTPPASFPTLYLACDSTTALAEVGSVFSHPSLITITIARNPIVVLSVDGVITDVVDLTSGAIRAFLGTTLRSSPARGFSRVRRRPRSSAVPHTTAA